ncbi:MAG: type II toxin-antitoxin system RelE/ParE family toxin [Chitinophagaceae bacterium]|nr:type II toxin-antitoxin system RelE/ParE family toxin [Chitinophagaceae bacterium]
MRKISWDKQATIQLSKAISFVREDSPQNADKVKKEILGRIDKLVSAPEINPPDKYKMNNSGNFRAFELHHYRISYLVKEEEIIIARIRHTSMQPLLY